MTKSRIHKSCLYFVYLHWLDEFFFLEFYEVLLENTYRKHLYRGLLSLFHNRVGPINIVEVGGANSYEVIGRTFFCLSIGKGLFDNLLAIDDV